MGDMFRFRPFFFGILFSAAFNAEAAINSLADYRAFVQSPAVESTFDLTGRVTYVQSPELFVLRCTDGSLYILHDSEEVRSGDRVRVSGTIAPDRATRTIWDPLKAGRIIVDDPGESPAPGNATIGDILAGRHYLQEVRVEGTVEDIIPDDIDPNWRILVLRDGGDALLVPLPAGADHTELTDARVAVTGICEYNQGNTRSLIGWRVRMKSTADLEVLETGTTREAAIPRLPSGLKSTPEAAIALGRRQTVGTVLAVWRGNLLVRDDNGSVLRVETDAGDKPAVGSRIHAVGQVETDLFRLNLSRARVRTLAPPPPNNKPPEAPLSEEDIYSTDTSHRAFQLWHLGRAISLTGIVRSLPIEGVEGSRALLACEDIDVPLDFHACPSALRSLPLGAKIAVSGVLVFETENWRASKPLPRITGMFVSVARAADVTILRAPAWWTPKRLFWLIGGLVLTLLAVSCWTFALRRLAERRGSELAAAQIAQAESEFRLAERARLAVELHDSVSQNLTGAALAIRAARRRAENETLAPLDIALKTLDATRGELRNCIWDLRNRALEEPDFAAAIRRTLEPLVSDERVRIRFPVPRALFSDSSAHAILSVVRELVANAIRHGHATSIAIAGVVQDNRLLCSVRDDGCGFDPENCPDVEQGHFGLQGIRERIKPFNGTLAITSRPHGGTKVAVSVSIPPPPLQRMKNEQDPYSDR